MIMGRVISAKKDIQFKRNSRLPCFALWDGSKHRNSANSYPPNYPWPKLSLKKTGSAPKTPSLNSGIIVQPYFCHIVLATVAPLQKKCHDPWNPLGRWPVPRHCHSSAQLAVLNATFTKDGGEWIFGSDTYRWWWFRNPAKQTTWHI